MVLSNTCCAVEYVLVDTFLLWWRHVIIFLHITMKDAHCQVFCYSHVIHWNAPSSVRLVIVYRLLEQYLLEVNPTATSSSFTELSIYTYSVQCTVVFIAVSSASWVLVWAVRSYVVCMYCRKHNIKNARRKFTVQDNKSVYRQYVVHCSKYAVCSRSTCEDSVKCTVFSTQNCIHISLIRR